MRVVLVFLLFVACSSSKKHSSDDDEEGTPPIPETSFTCDGKKDGFYADIEADCNVYHYCQTFVYPDDDSETKDWPFQCPPTTIFRQQFLTCSKPHKSFKCEDSEKFYDVNDRPAGTPPANKPVLPEEKPTTTPSPTTSLETEPPVTTETPEEPEEPTTTTPEKVETPPKPDEGFLLPPLKPGELEDQYFLLPHVLPYLLYPSLLPPWIHLHVKNPPLQPAVSSQHFKKFLEKVPVQTLDDYLKNTSWEKVEKHLKKGILPASTTFLEKSPVQTLDDYLKKTSWEKVEKHLKKGILPASTTLLEKLPEITIPKFEKKLFETSYTIKNGKLTDEPFQFKFFPKTDPPTGPR